MTLNISVRTQSDVFPYCDRDPGEGLSYSKLTGECERPYTSNDSSPEEYHGTALSSNPGLSLNTAGAGIRALGPASVRPTRTDFFNRPFRPAAQNMALHTRLPLQARLSYRPPIADEREWDRVGYALPL